ncbi:unnamed protein product [Ixodes persulcatus]
MFASISARSENAYQAANETAFLTGHFHQQNVIANGERNTMRFQSGYKYKIASVNHKDLFAGFNDSARYCSPHTLCTNNIRLR